MQKANRYMRPSHIVKLEDQGPEIVRSCHYRCAEALEAYAQMHAHLDAATALAKQVSFFPQLFRDFIIRGHAECSTLCNGMSK